MRISDRQRTMIHLFSFLLVASAMASPVFASAHQIVPSGFGNSAETEDFEGLAGIVFSTVINPANPHYVVSAGYLFRGDFAITFPESNPPHPEDPYGIGSVVVGDFTQGTDFWGLDSDRLIHTASDVYSGASYLGVQSGARNVAKVTFGFTTPVYRVGAWVNSSHYHDTPLVFEIIDSAGGAIDSVAVLSDNWAFVGLESTTPIRSISFAGYNPVIDHLTYEIPEPSTYLLCVAGLWHLTRRKN